MRPDDYAIGWICALPHELAASRAMLDEIFQPPKLQDLGDGNNYTFGKMAGHNVVMVCLQAGKYGLVSAANAAKDLKRSFPSVLYGLMVGIGGGVRTETHDIRLGDVAVSKPVGVNGGVIQYDIGRTLQDGTFERGHLNEPPPLMLSTMSKVQAMHDAQAPKADAFLEEAFNKYPNMKARYSRPTTDTRTYEMSRHNLLPAVHYGLIASGNMVITDRKDRERLLRANRGILCFEMEGAGLMNTLPCVVIRGISDYADNDKDDSWQRYAAITAAAYAKELLSELPVTNPALRRYSDSPPSSSRGVDVESDKSVTMAHARENAHDEFSCARKQTEPVQTLAEDDRLTSI